MKLIQQKLNDLNNKIKELTYGGIKTLIQL